MNDNNDKAKTDDEDDSDDNHTVPVVGQVKEESEDESQFQKPVASPNVTGEESIAGDAPGGEPQDIDQALADLGLENDEDGVKPLSSDDID